MAELDQVRRSAQRLAGLVTEMDAEMAVLVLTLPDGLRYHLKVERVYRTTGKGSARAKTLQRETVTVREGSQQGDVIYASPVEWLGEAAA